MITIKKNNLKVDINQFGATLDSIQLNGEEFLWQGDKESWEGKDVAIFPFVARLKDGYYLKDNKQYMLKTHGIIRYLALDVEDKQDNSVTLSLTYNEDTLKTYPYKFKYFAKFSIENDTLFVEYKVENLDNKNIYFGIGGHPALYIPSVRKDSFDDISGNSLLFNKELQLKNYLLDQTGCFVVGSEDFGNINKLELSKELFVKYPTIMLYGDKIDSVILNRKDNRQIKMTFKNVDILALWSMSTYGSYICVEPWSSIPDRLDPIREISNKDTLICLKEKDSYTLGYSIKIL